VRDDRTWDHLSTNTRYRASFAANPQIGRTEVRLGGFRLPENRHGSLLPVGSENPLLLDLAPDEVCHAVPLPETRWALTPPFHPYWRKARKPFAAVRFLWHCLSKRSF